VDGLSQNLGQRLHRYANSLMSDFISSESNQDRLTCVRYFEAAVNDLKTPCNQGSTRISDGIVSEFVNYQGRQEESHKSSDWSEINSNDDNNNEPLENVTVALIRKSFAIDNRPLSDVLLKNLLLDYYVPMSRYLRQLLSKVVESNCSEDIIIQLREKHRHLQLVSEISDVIEIDWHEVLKSHPKLKGENCVRQRDINDQADLSYLDEPTSAFDAYTIAIMARTQHFSYA